MAPNCGGQEDFRAARTLLPVVETQIGSDDPEVTRARALMSFLESNIDEDNPQKP